MGRPRKASARIYTRMRGGEKRYYGDFRLWKDVGGGREALIPKGSELATTDRNEAEQLYAARADQLNRARKRAEVLGDTFEIQRTAGLKEFAAHHLRQKAKSGRTTEQWLQVSEQQVQVAVDFFGANTELHTIRVPEVQEFANWLATQPVRRGKPRRKGDPPKRTLSPGPQRKYLNTLSNLFRRAPAENVVPVGHNPVAALLEKPVAARTEAQWREVHEAALLLESARTFSSKRPDIALPFAYPLIATFMLTGGRESEILGLEVKDVSFDRHTISFRPNQWRRLKTLTSHRTVPLFPQLEEILREYLFGGEYPLVAGLPSRHIGQRRRRCSPTGEKPSTRSRPRVGWEPGQVRSKMFRHGYCAARLQTLDRGAPISVYTVAKELGHGGDSMVKRVYGHLGTVRHRLRLVRGSREPAPSRTDVPAGLLSDRVHPEAGSADDHLRGRKRNAPLLPSPAGGAAAPGGPRSGARFRRRRARATPSSCRRSALRSCPLRPSCDGRRRRGAPADRRACRASAARRRC